MNEQKAGFIIFIATDGHAPDGDDPVNIFVRDNSGLLYKLPDEESHPPSEPASHPLNDGDTE